MTSCYCDYDDQWDHYVAHRPRARKAHRCEECGLIIEPRDRYERVSAVFCGRWQHFSTCVHCLTIRDAVTESKCFCWEHGNVQQAIQDYLDYGDFPPGGRFALMRLIAEHPSPRWSLR